MDWDHLPAELAAFADQLRNEESTEQTAQFIYTYRQKFESDWRARRILRSEVDGAPIPPPRNQGLHPAGCNVSEAYIKFEFHLGDMAQDASRVTAHPWSSGWHKDGSSGEGGLEG